jgi:hypothetical protein
MAKADKTQLDQKLLDEIEADVELLILVEMMNEALQELRKEKFGEFVCH